MKPFGVSICYSKWAILYENFLFTNFVCYCIRRLYCVYVNEKQEQSVAKYCFRFVVLKGYFRIIKHINDFGTIVLY